MKKVLSVLLIPSILASSTCLFTNAARGNKPGKNNSYSNQKNYAPRNTDGNNTRRWKRTINERLRDNPEFSNGEYSPQQREDLAKTLKEVVEDAGQDTENRLLMRLEAQDLSNTQMQEVHDFLDSCKDLLANYGLDLVEYMPEEIKNLIIENRRIFAEGRRTANISRHPIEVLDYGVNTFLTTVEQSDLDEVMKAEFRVLFEPYFALSDNEKREFFTQLCNNYANT